MSLDSSDFDNSVNRTNIEKKLRLPNGRTIILRSLHQCIHSEKFKKSDVKRDIVSSTSLICLKKRKILSSDDPISTIPIQSSFQNNEKQKLYLPDGRSVVFILKPHQN